LSFLNENTVLYGKRSLGDTSKMMLMHTLLSIGHAVVRLCIGKIRNTGDKRSVILVETIETSTPGECTRVLNNEK
jgi:hypothetical protein